MKDFLESAGGVLLDVLRSLCYTLDTIIYKFIIWFYDLFLTLSSGKILDSSAVEELSSRVGLIFGVFMLFMVIVAFIQYIIDPDKINDKETGLGTIIKKSITVVVLLGTIDFIFDVSYAVQNKLLGVDGGTNVIQNLFSPAKVDTDRFGAVLSSTLLTGFYSVNNDLIDGDLSNNEVVAAQQQDVNDCGTYIQALERQIFYSQEFSLGYNCLNEKVDLQGGNISGSKDNDYIINFDHIISVIVGGFVLWMLFIYCVNVGVRTIQIAFLQMISSAAIISYLSPKKDTMFSKWKNIYISTYIDVFIRVGIINLVTYLVAVILDGLNGGSTFLESLTPVGTVAASVDSSGNITGKFLWFIGIVMILALFSFAKKAPELLGELLPKGGASKIGFGIGKKGNDIGFGALMGGLSKGLGIATGAVGGFAGGVAAGSFGGAAFGLLRGGVGGLKNKKLGDVTRSISGGYKGQRDASKAMADILANGGNFLGAKRAQIDKALGRRTAYDRDQVRLSELDTKIGYFDAAEKEAESKALKNAEHYQIDSWDGSGKHSLDWLAAAKDNNMYDTDTRTKYAREYNKLLKAAKEFNMSSGMNVTDNAASVNFSNGGSLHDMVTSSGTYTSPADIERHFSELGGINDAINAHLEAFGVNRNGSLDRFTTAEAMNKANKNQKTSLTLSDSYQRNKANAGK